MREDVQEVFEGDVARSLRRMSLPMIAAFVFLGSVAVVDSLFIAQLGTLPLAGLGFALPLVSLLLQLVVGYGGGVTSAVSRAVGAQEGERAASLASHGLVLASVGALLVGGGLGVCLEPLVGILGAEADVATETVAYVGTWLWAMPFYAIAAVATAITRANGDTRSSGIAFLIAALVNVVSDPLLIFGWGPFPALGIRGAALATLLGFGAAAAYGMWNLVFFHRELCTWRSLGARLLRSAAAATLPVAATTTGGLILVPLTVLLLTSLLGGYGPEPVAAFGVVYRVQSLVSRAPLAVSAAMGPMVGMFWSANAPERLHTAALAGRRFALYWGVGCGVALVASSPLAAPLIEDPLTSEYLREMLLITAFGYASMGRIMMADAVYNNIGRAGRVAFLVTLRLAAFNLPLALIGGVLAGPAGIVASFPLAAILGDLAAHYFLRRDGLSRGATVAYGRRVRLRDVSTSSE